jgi:Mg-chelatase subunit ChlD
MTNSNFRWLLALLVVVGMVKACDRDGTRSQRKQEVEDRVARQIDDELKPGQAVEAREGLAAAVLIDVSGSMAEKISERDGKEEQKISVARRAALDIVDQFARYADAHKDEPVQLAVFEFSQRRGEPDCRPVVPMGPPDRERAAAAVARLEADGGTPIGQAMITAKRALDSTGLSRRHLLVVTDGENTDGAAPDRVAEAIGRRPESERPAIYFVAFDIAASRFTRVRDAGGLVLAAANARELNDTLDSLLQGKILVEK